MVGVWKDTASGAKNDRVKRKEILVDLANQLLSMNYANGSKGIRIYHCSRRFLDIFFAETITAIAYISYHSTRFPALPIRIARSLVLVSIAEMRC